MFKGLGFEGSPSSAAAIPPRCAGKSFNASTPPLNKLRLKARNLSKNNGPALGSWSLAGSWVIIISVMSRINIVVTFVRRGLIPPPKTAHEPLRKVVFQEGASCQESPAPLKDPERVFQRT